jgi:L,D-peptidoglycan transpeptidase YkuD (ErfK/YbiS/YcfS/YnhG family)
MDIIVTPDPSRPQRGTLAFGARIYDCVLGRSGVSQNKREGDGATPAGRFPVRRVLYRADRLPLPRTVLPLATIATDAGWCDAPEDRAYNAPVTLPYPASAEAMWREDDLYDVVVILGHNDAPVIPGAGSAIFLHVAPADGGPTAGCVAMTRSALIDLLGVIDRETAVIIQPAS